MKEIFGHWLLIKLKKAIFSIQEVKIRDLSNGSMDNKTDSFKKQNPNIK